MSKFCRLESLRLRVFKWNSYFMKNYMLYCGFLIVSVLLISVLMIIQLTIYSLNQQQSAYELFAARIRSATEIMIDDYAQIYGSTNGEYLRNHTSSSYVLYNLSMRQIAEESNMTIIVSDYNGNLLFYYDPQNPQDIRSNISPSMVAELEQGRYESALTNLDGFLPSMHYVDFDTIYNASNLKVAMVVVATPLIQYFGLAIDTIKILLATVIFLLMVGFVVTFFLARKVSQPLNEMAEIAKKYAEGDFSKRVISQYDCDEITDLALSLNDMAKYLEDSERRRTTFIENVSHELKTPMTSISGFADGILDGTIPPEEQHKYLKVISDEVKRLARLTVRMLQTTKVADAKFEIRKSVFNFSELVLKVVLSFENQINAKNLKVNINIQEQLSIDADLDNIYQVVYNLIDNALKFIDNEGEFGVIVEQRQDIVFFSVSNTGAKIPKEKILKLFDRFYKVDASRTIDTTGAGLGLYLVKKILNLHGSNVLVQSDDINTTFSFYLPASN